MNAASDQADFNFNYLPGYADFILQQKFEEYLQSIINTSREVKLPMLRYFEKLSAEEKDRIARETSKEFLNAIKDSKFQSFINDSTRFWVDNQLPVIAKDQVVVGDITLVNYCRRQALRMLIPYYTNDVVTTLEICREVDFFLMKFDAALFNTYINIQQENLSALNVSLTKSESRLLEAQHIAQIGSFEWDLTGGNSSFTPEVYKIFQFERSSGLENFLLDVHPEDKQKVVDAINIAMTSGIYNSEYRYIRNNNLKHIWSRGIVHYENGKPVRITGTIADTTEKAVLISKLRESEELNKQAQALSNTGNWKWNIEEKIIEWSDEMYRIYGLPPQSEKITFERFISFIHSDDKERRLQEITMSVQSGVATDYTMKIVTDSYEEKILRGKGKVLIDKNGLAYGMIGTCQDITVEYQLSKELMRKNEELTKKNMELESFNFIASHDLQEPLRKIQLYNSRLKSEAGDLVPKKVAYNLHRINKAAESLQTMIKDFLSFTRYVQMEEPEAITDLNELMKSIANEFDEQLKQTGMEISVLPLPKLFARRSHVYQAMRCIISNALKFHDPQKKSILKIHSEVLEEGGRCFYHISFLDNGIGFDMKYKERIFQLFQKLHSKSDYEGSGIGLSLCKKIIEDHGGMIRVKSTIGEGSVFSILLPFQKNLLQPTSQPIHFC